MIFSLKRINATVKSKNTHFINLVTILLGISLTKCYKLIINEDRHFQTGSKLSPELTVGGKQTI